MASQVATPLSEEQYLEIEREALDKSEFHDGQMFAMSGGSLNHALLAANAVTLLNTRVPAGCRVFTSDLRIKVAKARLYTYPDCSIVCGDPQLFGSQKDCLLNPLLIVEILSPSTENYDRGKKFELYRTIDSFCEYLIVHQDRRHVEYFSKQEDGSWLLREQRGVEGSIAIDRIGIRIALADLYASALDLES